MPDRRDSLIDRFALRRAQQIWARAADAAGTADPGTLRTLRGRARRFRRELDRLLRTAEGRLALPLVGSNVIDRPLGADWIWRPDFWREPVEPAGFASVDSRTELGPGLTLFHDCPLKEISARQTRNARPDDIAPFGLKLEVLGFGGSFLSLVIDLPQDAVAGLLRRHVLQADFRIAIEREIAVFARLNVRHGPNTEQIPARLPPGSGARMVEFDLAYSGMNERRVERLWLDLIFEGPALNAFDIRDITLCRRPRAGL